MIIGSFLRFAKIREIQYLRAFFASTASFNGIQRPEVSEGVLRIDLEDDRLHLVAAHLFSCDAKTIKR